VEFKAYFYVKIIMINCESQEGKDKNQFVAAEEAWLWPGNESEMGLCTEIEITV
jgi:hypothetical protein